MKFFKTRCAFVLQMGLLFVCYSVYTQNPSQIDVLTTEDGLVFRDVSGVVQDKKGLMWISTTQGLNRYDGHQFKAYTSNTENPYFIEEDFIRANMLYDDFDNSIWFLANDKLFQLHITTDSVVSYNEKHNLKGQVIGLFRAPDNAIWVVTDDNWISGKSHAKQYLQKYVDGNFEVMVATDRYKRGFNNISLDADGFIWWTTTKATYKYNIAGQLMETHIMDSYDWNGDIIHYVPQFFDSNNTHYYFPPSSGGIGVYDASNKMSKIIFDQDDIIRYAIEDKDQNIWFAGSETLYRMDVNKNFSNYTALLKSKLDYSSITDLFIDQIGLLWVTTDNGLFKVKTEKQLFANLFKSEKEGWGNSMRGIFEAADGRIFSLCESKHQLWYKTRNGIIDSLALKDTSGKPLSLMYDTSFFVTNKSKTKAYTIGQGIYSIDLETGQTKVNSKFKINNKIYGPNAILKLKDNRLLFGYTLEYLTLYNPETEESNLVFNNITEQSNITDLQFFIESKDPNCVWVGTKNDGVLKIDLNGNIIAAYNDETMPRLRKQHVLCIEEDSDGSLWVGTYGGGLKHIAENGKSIITYSKTNGLPSNNVVSILKDGSENLWIGTYNGLALFNKTLNKFQNFYIEDGLSHNEFNYSSFFKDSQGMYYFGGMNGINIFDPKALQESLKPPRIQFLGISGYNSKTKQNFKYDYAQSESKSIIVSPYDQYFEISWTLPSYFQNLKNTYRTKLEGFEDRWFYQGNSSSIRYNQLPAGDYVLKVKGQDSRGNESASILSIPITVKQIFYKKWWFIVLSLLTVIGIMFSVFRYRFKQALAMERLRTKISSDLHDDVGSLLSGLAMQTELMEINANDADKLKLQKIAGISRNAISQMRDLVWSIDSRRETINDLIERMHELAEELLLPKNITFNIDSSNIKNPNKRLTAQTKQNIFLIYKEAITNIIRHSDATIVKIAISNTYKGCEFTIKDNGSKKGDYKSTGLGLSNMQMRAEKLKGNLEFQNDNGFGVHLFLPFNM